MPTELLKQRLNASTSMLAAERRRLEKEILALEQKARNMANDALSDQALRALAQQVATEKAELARKEQLLREANELRGTLARDNAAAKEAARQAELDAAKQSLRAEVDAYLSDYAALVRNLRGAAHGIATLQARAHEIGLWAQHLSPTGRAPAVFEKLAHTRRLAHLIAHHMRRIPGHRERLGDLAWPSFADAEHVVGSDLIEVERARLQRHVIDVLATEG